MNPDKKTIDKKESAPKKSPDAVETPLPPQHMDPSKKPAKEKTGEKKSKIK